MRNWECGIFLPQPAYQCKHDENYLPKLTLLILCNHFKKKSFKNWYLENWKAFFKYQNVSICPSDNGLFTSITQKYQALKSQCHPHMARIMGHKNEKFTFYFTFNFSNCNILNSKPCQNCGYSLRKQ